MLIGFIKQMFSALSNFSESLAGIGNASNITIYMSENNQPHMTRPFLINLDLDKFD